MAHNKVILGHTRNGMSSLRYRYIIDQTNGKEAIGNMEIMGRVIFSEQILLYPADDSVFRHFCIKFSPRIGRLLSP
uniref:Uncharacterized protein n=1 Tax=Bracon brevicornis TaxID=1563983 RepID=A0A6V7JI48_9HYME